jgi:heptosyltransferase III
MSSPGKQDSPGTGRILIIRGGAIGDFILTLPAMAALREHFPRVPLEVLGYKHITQLALAGGLADRVRSVDSRPLASFFAKGGDLPEELCEYFGGFAVIVSYLYDPDGIFQENVARCTKAQFLAGPHRPDENCGIHATEVFLKPLERLAIFDADPVPRLDLGLGEKKDTAAGSLPVKAGKSQELHGDDERKWLALHPGSGSEQKNWPEGKWVALLERLVLETELQFLLVGGEAEGERIERLAARVPVSRSRKAVGLPLAELAVLLSRSWGYIGHDSGISHMAAALGLQGVVLWGDTREDIWRPRSRRIWLLQAHRGLQNLALDDVWAAFQQRLLSSAA